MADGESRNEIQSDQSDSDGSGADSDKEDEEDRSDTDDANDNDEADDNNDADDNDDGNDNDANDDNDNDDANDNNDGDENTSSSESSDSDDGEGDNEEQNSTTLPMGPEEEGGDTVIEIEIEKDRPSEATDNSAASAMHAEHKPPQNWTPRKGKGGWNKNNNNNPSGSNREQKTGGWNKDNNQGGNQKYRNPNNNNYNKNKSNQGAGGQNQSQYQNASNWSNNKSVNNDNNRSGSNDNRSVNNDSNRRGNNNNNNNSHRSGNNDNNGSGSNDNNRSGNNDKNRSGNNDKNISGNNDNRSANNDNRSGNNDNNKSGNNNKSGYHNNSSGNSNNKSGYSNNNKGGNNNNNNKGGNNKGNDNSYNAHANFNTNGKDPNHYQFNSQGGNKNKNNNNENNGKKNNNENKPSSFEAKTEYFLLLKKSLLYLIKPTFPNPIDSPILRLHYRLAVTVFFIMYNVVQGKWWLGTTIHCVNLFNSDLKGVPDYQKHYCLSYSYVCEDQNIKGDCSARRYLLFYRWVQYCFLLLSGLYYLPRYVAKTMDNPRLIRLLKDLAAGEHRYDGCSWEKDTEMMVSYMRKHRHTHTSLYCWLIISHILALGMDLAAILFLDYLLQGHFIMLVPSAYPFTRNPQNFTDSLSRTFPPFAHCELSPQMLINNKRTEMLACYLLMMEMYDKNFIFLWLCLVVVTILTVLTIFFLLLASIPPVTRVFLLLHTHSPGVAKLKKKMLQLCGVSDLYVLYLFKRYRSEAQFIMFMARYAHNHEDSVEEILEANDVQVGRGNKGGDLEAHDRSRPSFSVHFSDEAVKPRGPHGYNAQMKRTDTSTPSTGLHTQTPPPQTPHTDTSTPNSTYRPPLHFSQRLDV